MFSQKSKFTLRIDTELLKKFRYIAGYNGSSANCELENLIRKYVAAFEKKHGVGFNAVCFKPSKSRQTAL